MRFAEWTLVLPRADAVRAPAERRSARPGPRLAGHVLGYVSHDFHRTDALPWRFTPLGVVTVTLDFGAPTRRVAGAAHDLPRSPVLACATGHWRWSSRARRAGSRSP